MKHFIPLFLALTLLLCMSGCGGGPETAPEAPAQPPLSQSEAPVTMTESVSAQLCGPTVTWSLTDGTLTLSGQGATSDYELLETPWDQAGVSLQVRSLMVEEGVAVLGSNTFSACLNLSSVSLPSTLEAIGESAFADCAALSSILLPASLRSIGDSAFVSTGLTSVTLPQGLAQLGSNAFSNCAALRDASVPGSVVTLGENVFYGCDSLASLTVPEGSPAETLLRGTIPEELLRLSAPAPDARSWEGTTGNLVWSLRGGVLTVGSGASLPDYASSGYGAAPWSPMSAAVESVVISEGVERIGNYAFWNCPNLRSVALPSSLAEIGDSAFGACEKLASLSLPGRLRSIGSGAFAFCQSLTELALPEGLQTVGDDAFRMCTGLTRISAPGSISSVGSGAFAFGCAEFPEYTAPEGSAAARALDEARISE